MRKRFIFRRRGIDCCCGFSCYYGYENEKNVPDLFDANSEALTSDEVIIQRPCVYYPSRICYILDDDLGYTEVKGCLY